LQRATAAGGVAGDACPAQRGQDAGPAPPALGDVDHRRGERRFAVHLCCHQEHPLGAEAEADRRGRVATEVFDQTVVTAASAKSVLGRLESGRLYFESGAGVVVLAADQPGLEARPPSEVLDSLT